MKTLIDNLLLASLILAAIFITMNPAVAGERYQVFEMGESGPIIEFPSTGKGLETDDVEIATGADAPRMN